jgi:hypothetical protein
METAGKMKFGTAQTYFNDVWGRIVSDSPVWSYRTVPDGSAQLPTPPEVKISVPTWKDDLYLKRTYGYDYRSLLNMITINTLREPLGGRPNVVSGPYAGIAFSRSRKSARSEV